MRTRRPEGLRRRRRRLRRLHHRHGDDARPPRRAITSRRSSTASTSRCPTARPTARAAFRPRRTSTGRSSRASTRQFNGLGANPVGLPRDRDHLQRRRPPSEEAARCYRCDAETGSSDYCGEDARGHLRDGPDAGDDDPHAAGDLSRSDSAVKAKTYEPRTTVPSLDDIVLLPANLSRLVIDPYRDACRLDDGPRRRPEARLAVARDGLRRRGRRRARGSRSRPPRTAACLPRPPSDRRGGALAPDRAGRRATTPHADAGGVVSRLPDGFHPVSLDRQAAGAAHRDLRRSVRAAARHPVRARAELDLLVLEASSRISEPWPSWPALPDFAVLRDAMRIVRG